MTNESTPRRLDPSAGEQPLSRRTLLRRGAVLAACGVLAPYDRVSAETTFNVRLTEIDERHLTELEVTPIEEADRKRERSGDQGDAPDGQHSVEAPLASRNGKVID